MRGFNMTGLFRITVCFVRYCCSHLFTKNRSVALKSLTSEAVVSRDRSTGILGRHKSLPDKGRKKEEKKGRMTNWRKKGALHAWTQCVGGVLSGAYLLQFKVPSLSKSNAMKSASIASDVHCSASNLFSTAISSSRWKSLKRHGKCRFITLRIMNDHRDMYHTPPNFLVNPQPSSAPTTKSQS